MPKFEPSQFISRVGQRLVVEFEHASDAGTPGLIGSAREHPARLQLEKILPALASVGTGLLIDSYGGQSTQQDIVIYERDYCPIYSINSSPEATYYPIEGVIAIGEVKSIVSKDILFDALNKVRSAKLLKRHSEKSNDGIGPLAPFRMYGSSAVYAPGPNNEYNQLEEYRDQIYTFILCKRFSSAPETVLDNIIEYQRQYGHEHMPNMIISLENGFLQGMLAETGELQNSAITSNSFAFVPTTEYCFSYLFFALQNYLRHGRSVPLTALDRYLRPADFELPNFIARRFEV